MCTLARIVFKFQFATENYLMPIQRVLTETNKTHNWGVFSTGLLLRSRLEAEKSRTVERSAMQMQV